jgi:hypothetical protein
VAHASGEDGAVTTGASIDQVRSAVWLKDVDISSSSPSFKYFSHLDGVFWG